MLILCRINSGKGPLFMENVRISGCLHKRVRILFAFSFFLFVTGFFLCPGSADDTTGPIRPAKKWIDPEKPYEKIVVTEQDITDRPYEVLGEIQVQVSKYQPGYQQEAVKKLQMYAFTMGADAVVRLTVTSDPDYSSANQYCVKGLAVSFKN
jgi:hypothetical protein